MPPFTTPLTALRAFSRLTPRSSQIQLSSRIFRPITHPQPFLQPSSYRPLSTTRSLFSNPNPSPEPTSPSTPTTAKLQSKPQPPRPTYELTFTCTPCSTRSTHSISKQGYHHGSVLITCPSCRNRHIISDHLGIFGDKKLTIEDLMRDRGELVKKGSLGEDGDVEFWDDGSKTARGEGAGIKGEGPFGDGRLS